MFLSVLNIITIITDKHLTGVKYAPTPSSYCMETSERLVLFKAVPFTSAFNDALRILKENDLCIDESDPDKGLIRATVDESRPMEDYQIVAKFWKGRERILIGLRGSVSFSFSGADKLKRKLKKLERELRRLDYAY